MPSSRGSSQAIFFLQGILLLRDLPDPGIELRSPALQTDSLQSEPPAGGEQRLKLESTIKTTVRTCFYVSANTKLKL